MLHPENGLSLLYSQSTSQGIDSAALLVNHGRPKSWIDHGLKSIRIPIFRLAARLPTLLFKIRIANPDEANMSRTREENAQDLMQEEQWRSMLDRVFVVVSGTPSIDDDSHVPGVHYVLVDPDLTSAQKADVALHYFRENCGIQKPDDFSISVHDGRGQVLEGEVPEGEEVGIWTRGEYGDYFWDDKDIPDAIRRVMAEQPSLPASPAP